MTSPAIGTPFSLSLRFKALRTALVSGSAYMPLSMLLRAQSLNTAITYEGGTVVLAPVNTVVPAVTGTGTVGQILTTDNGTWSGSPTGYAYQWRRADMDIAGATASTYMLVTADGGTSVTCRVLATNGGGSTGAVSNVVSVAALASTAPGYLATVTSAPAMVGGAQRLVSGYSGSLFQLRRASDAATMDVSPQTGGDYPDYAAITTWAAGSPLTVATIYDQTGNARHLMQATVANQPSFDPSIRIGVVAPFLWDGQRSAVGGPVTKVMALAGQSFSRQNISVVDIQQREVSFSDNIDWMFADGSSGTIATNYATGYTAGLASLPATGKFIRPGTGTTQFPSDTTATPRASPDVTVETMGTSNLRALLIRGNYYTSTATTVAAATMTNLVLGRQSGDITTSGVYTYNSRTMRIGFALYPALSQADATTVAASLRTAFSIPTSFDYRLVFAGDSIMEGSGTALNGNVPNQIQPYLTKKAEVFNTGLHGKLMADMYNNRVAFFSTLFAAGVPNVIFLQAGTNDLRNGTTGSTLYSTYTAPLVTYLKSLGFKVVVCTILPYATGGGGPEKTIYNGIVAANSAGADYILDLTQNPVMGVTAAPNDTTLYVDGLHPTKLGDTWLTGAPSGTYANDNTYYHALQQALGVTP